MSGNGSILEIFPFQNRPHLRLFFTNFGYLRHYSFSYSKIALTCVCFHLGANSVTKDYLIADVTQAVKNRLFQQNIILFWCWNWPM